MVVDYTKMSAHAQYSTAPTAELRTHAILTQHPQGTCHATSHAGKMHYTYLPHATQHMLNQEENRPPYLCTVLNN